MLTFTNNQIVCCEAVRSAILATVWLLVISWLRMLSILSAFRSTLNSLHRIASYKLMRICENAPNRSIFSQNRLSFAHPSPREHDPKTFPIATFTCPLAIQSSVVYPCLPTRLSVNACTGDETAAWSSRAHKPHTIKQSTDRQTDNNNDIYKKPSCR